MTFRMASISLTYPLFKKIRQRSDYTGGKLVRSFKRNNDLRLVDTTPLHKWKDDINKFRLQPKDAHLPYFMRTNPWLKELRFSPADTVKEKGNFLTVNKTLYELCRHNVVFH